MEELRQAAAADGVLLRLCAVPRAHHVQPVGPRAPAEQQHPRPAQARATRPPAGCAALRARAPTHAAAPASRRSVVGYVIDSIQLAQSLWILCYYQWRKLGDTPRAVFEYLRVMSRHAFQRFAMCAAHRTPFRHACARVCGPQYGDSLLHHPHCRQRAGRGRERHPHRRASRGDDNGSSGWQRRGADYLHDRAAAGP